VKASQLLGICIYIRDRQGRLAGEHIRVMILVAFSRGAYVVMPRAVLVDCDSDIGVGEPRLDQSCHKDDATVSLMRR
jgi:hypothetical protein